MLLALIMWFALAQNINVTTQPMHPIVRRHMTATAQHIHPVIRRNIEHR
jgi:hypothetical protein